MSDAPLFIEVTHRGNGDVVLRIIRGGRLVAHVALTPDDVGQLRRALAPGSRAGYTKVGETTHARGGPGGE